jgi:WD40 repeat protein
MIEQQVIGPHPGGARHLATAYVDGVVRLVSGSDWDVRVWDLTTGAELARSPDHYSGINSMAVCQLVDSHPVIAVATEDGVSWWDPVTGDEPYPDADVGTMWALAAAATPDGAVTLFGAAHLGRPFPVHRWDAASGRLGTPLGHHDDCVKSVSALPLAGGLMVASGDDSGVVRRWDALTATEVGTPLTGHDLVLALALTRFADGRVLLASGCRDSTLRRWDAFTGELIGSQTGAHADGLISLCAAVIGGQPQLISAGCDGVVRRWDAASGDLIDEPLSGYSATVFTINGTYLIAAGTIDNDSITIRQLAS